MDGLYEVPQLQMSFRQSDVREIIKRLPLADSLAALDYMARTVWEGPEYDITINWRRNEYK